MEEKTCRVCQKTKLLTEFTKRKVSKDGYLNQCKLCRNEKNKKWYKNNREKKKGYYERNKEHIRKYHREYHEKNLEKYNERNRKWQKNNKARANENWKKWVKAHPRHKKAYIICSNALASGKITKAKNCSECNSTQFIQAHHENYDKPLEVISLCRSCHMKLHAKLRRLKKDEKSLDTEHTLCV